MQGHRSRPDDFREPGGGKGQGYGGKLCPCLDGPLNVHCAHLVPCYTVTMNTETGSTSSTSKTRYGPTRRVRPSRPPEPVSSPQIPAQLEPAVSPPPVTAVRKNHDPEETRQLQITFLTHLANLRAYGAACRATGVSPRQVQEWQKAPAFKDQLGDVRALVQGEIEHAGIARAIGVGGKGSDLLLMFFLKAADPSKYREVVQLSDAQEIGKEALRLFRKGYQDEKVKGTRDGDGGDS